MVRSRGPSYPRSDSVSQSMVQLEGPLLLVSASGAWCLGLKVPGLGAGLGAFGFGFQDFSKVCVGFAGFQRFVRFGVACFRGFPVFFARRWIL